MEFAKLRQINWNDVWVAADEHEAVPRGVACAMREYHKQSVEQSEQHHHVVIGPGQLVKTGTAIKGCSVKTVRSLDRPKKEVLMSPRQTLDSLWEAVDCFQSAIATLAETLDQTEEGG